MKSSPISALAYRPEIDGLRALAVLPVILFHAGFRQFGGGFVGVDVFFVISGYLITSILLKDIFNGSFSLMSFYERRARRILPALFLVLAVSMPFAWFLMMPSELEEFAKSLIAVSLFSSNIFFQFTVNYFDQAVEMKPLIHTWSLGVEEQFYIVFPVILFLIFFKFGWKTAWASILALMLASFLWSEYSWRTGDAETSFFFTPLRAWELLAGSLCAFVLAQKGGVHSSPKIREILSAGGVLAIASAIAFFDKDTPSPSYYIALPVLGAVFIILYAGSDNFTGRMLSKKTPVFIGLLSYSAYLWHQPVFAFSRLVKGKDFSHLIAVALIILVFILAWLSWKYVEQPVRKDATFWGRKRVFQLWLIGSIFFIVIGAVTVFQKGFISRVPEERRAFISYYDVNRNGAYVLTGFNAKRGDFSESTGKEKILLIGDSFAQDFFNMMSESGAFLKSQVKTFYVPAKCQLYIGDADVSEYISESDQGTCAEYVGLSEAFDNIARADVIIMTSSWRKWSAQKLPDTIKRMNLRPEQKVIVVGSKNFGDINLKELESIPIGDRPNHRVKIDDEFVAINELLKSVPAQNISFVSIYDLLCDKGNKCPLFTPEGGLISYDGRHLTKEGAVYIGGILFQSRQMSLAADPVKIFQ